MKSLKVSILSLGCPKNLVDSEAILSDFSKKGFQIVDEAEECDIAVVNTCAFIEDAKKESIDAILDLIQLKKEGKIKKIIVTGCLSQRYGKTLRKELAEVDVFWNIKNFAKKKIDRRLLITPPHYAYLKISEGCDNKCKYCVIPRIRGPYKSRAMRFITEELKNLYDDSEGKLREINLISQDLTYYGMDLYGRLSLAELLRNFDEKFFLKSAGNLKWVRLLYTHPAHFTDELIDVVKDNERICKYIDLPVQHINDAILKAMGRKVTKKYILDLIARLRKNIPGLAIRSSLIVGFPGESRKEFKELLKFIKDEKFERLGIFDYSRQEGVPAYNFKNQVDEKEKQDRLDEAMKLQQEVSKDINSKFLDRTLSVLIDQVGLQDDNKTYIGRSYADAPEVDGEVFLKSPKPLKQGDLVNVKIIDTLEYDLVAELV